MYSILQQKNILCLSSFLVTILELHHVFLVGCCVICLLCRLMDNDRQIVTAALTIWFLFGINFFLKKHSWSINCSEIPFVVWQMWWCIFRSIIYHKTCRSGNILLRIIILHTISLTGDYKENNPFLLSSYLLGCKSQKILDFYP